MFDLKKLKYTSLINLTLPNWGRSPFTTDGIVSLRHSFLPISYPWIISVNISFSQKLSPSSIFFDFRSRFRLFVYFKIAGGFVISNITRSPNNCLKTRKISSNVFISFLIWKQFISEIKMTYTNFTENNIIWKKEIYF